MDIKTDKTYAVGDIPWLYPHRDKPPRGMKLNLLQEGGVAIHGEWKDNAGYIAWQYLFRRDKEAEAEMGKIKQMNLEGMAESMDMLRRDLVKAGVVAASVPPMFMTEAILGYIGSVRTMALEEAKNICMRLEGRSTITRVAFADAIAERIGQPAEQPAPIDMILHCPKCQLQHIDEPESYPNPQPDGGYPGCDACTCTDGCAVNKALWTNPPHRSHLCHGCGHIWRPADVPTNGVKAIKTKGKNDSQPAELSLESLRKDAARYRFDQEFEYQDYVKRCAVFRMEPMSLEEYRVKSDAITDEKMEAKE